MTTVGQVNSATTSQPQKVGGSSKVLSNTLSGNGNTNNTQQSTKETTSQTPKLDELKKLCAKFKLNLKELCGYTLEELDEEKSEKCLNFIKSFIKTDTQEFDTEKLNKYNELKSYLAEVGLTFEEVSIASVDKLSSKNLEDIKGAVKLAQKLATDKNEVIKLAKKYITVLASGSYTLNELEEAYNKKQSDPLKGESLTERLQRMFPGELKGKKLSELSPEKQKELIERYFNGYFQELLAKHKNNPEKIYRLQMRDFAKLLANTPDEEKGFFRDAISNLLSENRLKGIFATKQSFLTQEALTNWANGWSVEQQAALGKVDQFGKKPSSEDVTAMDASILQEQDETGRENSHNEIIKKIQDIQQKIENNEELTEEEKLIYELHKELLAGDKLGTATNSVCDKEWLNSFSKKIDSELYNKFGEETYRDVLNQVKNTIEKHPETLTMPGEELVQLLDEATNGNYSKVVSGSNEPLSAPKEETTLQTVETHVFTYTEDTQNRVIEQKTTREQAQQSSKKIQTIRSQIAPQETIGFTVAPSKQTTSTKPSNKLTAKEEAKLEKDAVKNGQIDKYLKATGKNMFEFAASRVADWHNTGKTTQEKIVAYASRALCSTQVALGMMAANSEKCFRALAEEVNFANLSINLTHKQKEIVEEMA